MPLKVFVVMVLKVSATTLPGVVRFSKESFFLIDDFVGSNESEETYYSILKIYKTTDKHGQSLLH